MNKIFNTKYTSWQQLENVIASMEGKKEKGDIFEEFVYFYLQYHSELYQIKELHCPAATGRGFSVDVLKKLKLEKSDHGVDGVLITTQDKWIAFQIKFRSQRLALGYHELATFWTEAEYADSRMIITNSQALPNIAEKKSGHIVIMSNVLDELDEEFFSALQQYAQSLVIPKRKPKQPRDYQTEILADLSKGLAETDRGKLIAACGIGKTLIALWLTEQRGDQTVLFLAPSLQLIRQTLGEWAREASEAFEYLCVCSDQTVDIDDEAQLATSELDIPVTTDSSSIRQFIGKSSNKKRIIFSTYQSVPVLKSALKGLSNIFDIAFYDEAHRTAGVSDLNLFSLAIQNENIPAKKRLFMTATERVVKPRLRNIAEEMNQVVFSMDDISKYGKTYHHLGFGKAIEKKIVSDYRIVFAGITQKELNDYISKNRYVTYENAEDEFPIETAQSIYKRVLLKKCFSELSVRKVISFHSKVSEAKLFAQNFNADLAQMNLGETSVSHVNGSMTSIQRSSYIKAFEESDAGVVTNVRCLTEGVDIPLIDGVYFANPKGSIIDIVQAVGRALRQPFGSTGKIAYIILPVLIDEQNQSNLTGEGFDALFNVIQALRDQDETLAEWIDQINLGVVTGRTQSRQDTGKIKIVMPPNFDTEALESSLLIKIAKVNRDPSDHVGIGSKLGKKERKSSHTRVFKTLCDYTPDKVFEGLVAPTLTRVGDVAAQLTSSELKFSNNNVSHCERLGVIEKVSSKIYQMTPLGIKLKESQIDFTQLFRNQMLLFSFNTGKGKLYPYREAFKFMRDVKELGFIDFVYGIYSLQVDNNGIALLQDAIDISKKIQNSYPNIEITSESNKEAVLERLNSMHPSGFTYNDVWTDRTTTGNQYRYLIRHLELFNEIFEFKNKRLYLKTGAEYLIDKYLNATQFIGEYGSHWWIDIRNIE